jgi:DNA-binding transcriptional ArsR family regulator
MRVGARLAEVSWHLLLGIYPQGCAQRNPLSHKAFPHFRPPVIHRLCGTNMNETSYTGGSTLSIQAMAWAIEQQEVKDPAGRLVLLCLANYAGADGRSAFPSVLRLSRDTGLSDRAVQIHLRKLEKLGLIRRGKQVFAQVYIGHGGRTPFVYDLIISTGERDAPQKAPGVNVVPAGVKESASRGERGSPNPDLIRDQPKSVQRTFEDEFRDRFGGSPAEVLGGVPEPKRRRRKH